MKQAIVIYGATALGSPEFSSDLLWRTGGYSVSDPVFYCEIDGKKILLLSSLEIERGEWEADVDEVVSIEKFSKHAKEKNLPVSVLFLKDRGIEEIIIPNLLRFSLGRILSEHFKIITKEAPFFSERSIKKEKEIKEIKKCQKALEDALWYGLKFLKECRVNKGLLYHPNNPKTAVVSGTVRKIIDNALYFHGCLGVGTIVACGAEAVDPHSIGYGKLKAREPIVIDIFPRSLETLYFADQTRTVFKGKPSSKMIKMYDTVLQGQKKAIGEIKEGVLGKNIEQNVRDFFDRSGYPTAFDKRPVSGFIHSLGHGVGIDIHEAPSFGSNGQIFRTGNVITIEPGLYYPKKNDTIPRGGIRIEDMVLVTKKGCQNFSSFPKELDDMII